MNELVDTKDIALISDIYSYLGKQILSGDIETVKYFYGNGWKESPPLIKAIGLLQDCLTAVEIENNIYGNYCDEFLYYWAMLCIGEQSKLISKDLETAEICLRRVVDRIPKSKARLAFIELMKSDEPARSNLNIERIDILRQWAGKQDLFSRIALSKIIFYQFLNEGQIDNCNLPIKMLWLLESPCKKGHPVAIRFYNEVISCIGIFEAVNMERYKLNINANILYDFE